MYRIKVVGKVLISAFIFYGYGYFLHYFFPHISFNVEASLVIVLLFGFFYFIYINKKKLIEEKSSYIPEYLKSSSFLYLIIGSILAHFAIDDTFKTTFIIDNGKSTSVKVYLLNQDTLLVPAKGYITTSLPLGNNEIIVNGKPKTISTPEKSKWIFNIDSINSYYESSVNYSNTLFKNGKVDSSFINSPHIKFVNGELIRSDVDFVFEAPNTITVDRSAPEDKAVERKILYRLPSNEIDSIKN